MLRYAPLGLLARHPKHGYDWKNQIEQTLGGFWTINFRQICTPLSRLERDGSVDAKAEDEDGRVKKTSCNTAAGRKKLDGWLSEAVEKPQQLRGAFFVKVVIARLTGRARRRRS